MKSHALPLLLPVVFVTAALAAGPQSPPYAADELLVRFAAAIPTAEIGARLGARDVTGARRLRLSAPGSPRGRVFLVRLRPGLTVETALTTFAARPGVEQVQPNFRYHKAVSDPRFPELWGLRNTGQAGLRGPLAPIPDADIEWDEAWDLIDQLPLPIQTEVIVAVIDTGVSYDHADLAAVMWTNPGELPGNGVDDDGNGFVDDIHGYDWAYNDSDPSDDEGHGTHVAGTIAAAANNGAGIVGVARRNVKIMAMKFLDATGSGSTADAIEAIDYAVSHGAKVLSNSWSGGPYETALFEAIGNAGSAGAVFVAAAGNEASDNDLTPVYPASYDLPNVVSVAASTRHERLAEFSNWGKTTVDLAAPGEEILSTVISNTYAFEPQWEGTSAAVAHVSGAAAIVYSLNLVTTPAAVRELILAAVEPAPAYAGRVTTEGRLNLANVVERGLGLDPVPPAPVTDLLPITSTSNAVTLRLTATGDDGAAGRATRYELAFAPTAVWIDYANATKVSGGVRPATAGQTDYVTATGLSPGTSYTMQLKVLDNTGNSSLSNAVTLATAPPILAFADDMENGTAGWTTESNQPQTWQLVPLQFHSPVHAWTDSLGPYANNLDSSLISPPIDLTGAGSATLTFWQSYDLDSGQDFGYIEIFDGNTWRTLQSVTGRELEWKQRSIDLTAYAGFAVRVRFRLQTDASVQKDGWYVDDVSVGQEPAGSTVAEPDVATGWTTEGTWGIESSSYLSDSPGVNYAPNVLAAATLATPVDLSHASRAYLSFDLEYDIETDRDWVSLEVSTDAVEWAQVRRYTGTRSGFLREAFDLSRLAGYPAVWLRLVISSDAAVGKNGALIDNLKVDAVPMPDGDGDGTPDVFDCAPTDGAVVAAPREISNLSWLGHSLLQWDSDAGNSGSGTVYQVLRGNVGEYPVGNGLAELCLETASADTGTEDTEPLALDHGFFYLVRGANSCGYGTYGFAAVPALVERQSGVCP